MHALAHALAVCLALGPAPVGQDTTPVGQDRPQTGEVAASPSEGGNEVEPPRSLDPSSLDETTSDAPDADDEAPPLAEAEPVADEALPLAGTEEPGADEASPLAGTEPGAAEAPPLAEAEPVADEAPPTEPELGPETEREAPSLAEPAPAGRLGCGGGKSCERMTITGIVVGVLGVGAVGAGVGMLLNPDRVIAEEPIFVSSTRPAGLVIVTLGVGVTLTAVLMLVAAHKGQRAGARVALTPSGLRF